ncbi:TIM-barrel signal transduction protein [Cutibacterium acnes JCM 18918]|nr:TIM-barrel signal transduction protein [Cutibacterium acnes JCM 18918]
MQNFPTVGLIDGTFRANLEETGMGYGLEIDMIKIAHDLDLLTSPYVFDVDQAKDMARAGSDILVPHMGLTTSGTIGAKNSTHYRGCCCQGSGTRRRRQIRQSRHPMPMPWRPHRQSRGCAIHSRSHRWHRRLLRRIFHRAIPGRDWH